MRRLIASIAVFGLLALASGPAFAGTSAMPCCRKGAAMACCLPGPAGAMKACPAPEAAAVLPGLPPAIVNASLGLSAPPEAAVTVIPNAPAPRALPLSPPDLPPRA